MDNVSIFCADRHSVKELKRTCIEFGKASGVKINSAKSETLLFCHWTLTRDLLPFPIKLDFLKILGVRFSREEKCVVVGKKETSILAGGEMIHSLLLDYAPQEESDNNSDDDTWKP
ncbi:hypothetical protein NDU88_009771 [Pleurodeles waltl]|uniref:Reverse transcriptase n=1 Tax=Pleurodeles waltl TaxID=8319 RepID=A0AAV7QVK1_PLEWA|nr:hypothetical protein NDU88_009771 [Pleurodeles waltl]